MKKTVLIALSVFLLVSCSDSKGNISPDNNTAETVQPKNTQQTIQKDENNIPEIVLPDFSFETEPAVLTNIYINDVSAELDFYLDENGEICIPFLDTFYIMEKDNFTEKNGIIVLNEQLTTHPQRGMYIFFSDSKIHSGYYDKSDTAFPDEDFVQSTVRGIEYTDKKGKAYCDIAKFRMLTNCSVYTDGTNLWIDSALYYKNNHTIWDNVGRITSMTAYINDRPVDSPVYYNNNSMERQSYSGSYDDYIELLPALEAIGAPYRFEEPNKYIAEIGGKECIFGAFDVVKDGELYNNGGNLVKGMCIIEGKAYIPIVGLRIATSGSLSRPGKNDIRVYTPDYVRPDIPKDLESTYPMLDNMISVSSKDYIAKLEYEELLSQTHLGIGMWMRNIWLYPSGSKLTEYFLEKGFEHPDDMSAFITTGYWLYLNGEPCGYNDVENYQKAR